MNHFINQEAQDYLTLVLALEMLKQEYQELRLKNKNPLRRTHEEIQFRLVIISLEFIVTEALWNWLETCP